MGLLDDAIREHLELRRRHGADPSEVASKEHEALGPATVRAAGALPADADGRARFAAEPSLLAGSMTAEDRRRERARSAPDGTSNDAYLSQETVELDMLTVLHEDESVGIGYAARGGVRSMTSPLR
jgi:hypothetical protein